MTLSAVLSKERVQGGFTRNEGFLLYDEMRETGDTLLGALKIRIRINDVHKTNNENQRSVTRGCIFKEIGMLQLKILFVQSVSVTWNISREELI